MENFIGEGVLHALFRLFLFLGFQANYVKYIFHGWGVSIFSFFSLFSNIPFNKVERMGCTFSILNFPRNRSLPHL
jgi:hypothetical protein